ncbi:MAG: cation-efflux pump [Robiginitomaculum sp.]|nr:MAG: cation-efflux pump [Robiginitomaculum sp.]
MSRAQKPIPKRPPGSIPFREGRPGRLSAEASSRITRRITAFSVGVGIILISLKFIVFRETGSVGILSSLVHSSLDLFAALSSFFAVRYAARAPDAGYRFGRGKAEGFSAVLQVCLISLAAVHLLEEAAKHVENPHMIEQGGYAIAVMVFAILLTTWLLIAQTWAIKATGSLAIRGDRAHYIADMSANIAVIVGVALTSYSPLLRADALVGVGIALWLFYTAYRIARLAWSQLMDQELPERERELIRELALRDDSINGVHDLRTRASGPHVHIQMQLDLDDDLSLMEAHKIVVAAETRMMEAYPAADILIHPHPSGCHKMHGNAIFRQDYEHQDYEHEDCTHDETEPNTNKSPENGHSH